MLGLSSHARVVENDTMQFMAETLGCWPSHVVEILGIHLPTHGLLPTIKHGLPENPTLRNKIDGVQIKYLHIKVRGFLSHVWWNRRVVTGSFMLFPGCFWAVGPVGVVGCHQVTASTEAATFCTSASAIARTMCNGSVAASLTWLNAAKDPTFIDWDSMTKVKWLFFSLLQ